MLAKVKAGVSRMAPASARRPKRPPVTIEHMQAFRRGLDLTNAFDSTVFACDTAAYSGCNRLGELLITSPNTFKHREACGSGCAMVPGI
jgi:hypothetical protein